MTEEVSSPLSTSGQMIILSRGPKLSLDHLLKMQISKTKKPVQGCLQQLGKYEIINCQILEVTKMSPSR